MTSNSPNMDRNIDRPIFLIGCPRSGTTIIFDALSIHPDLSWFSQYLDRRPHCPWVNLINRIAHIPFARKRINRRRNLFPFIPEPSEGWEIWRQACGDKFLYSSVNNRDPVPEEKQKIEAIMKDTLVYQGRKRFVAKLTGPPRIIYLKKIFPDAVFIHIIRDGRAVVNSLLKVFFWKQGHGYDKPWWEDLPEEDYQKWIESKKSPHALAALQWKNILQQTESEMAGFSTHDFLTVKYEDFTENPQEVIRNIFEACSLNFPANIIKHLKNLDIKSMDYKWKADLKRQDLAMIENLIGETLLQYGYQLIT